MRAGTLKQRVAVLEHRFASLRRSLRMELGLPAQSWLDQVYGSFANDPIYEEAMRLGRQYRESLRPKQSRRRNGHSRHRPR